MAYRYGTRPALRRRADRSVSMTARKPGPCAACAVPIRPGDAIYWWPSTGAAFHAGCTGDSATAPARALTAAEMDDERAETRREMRATAPSNRALYGEQVADLMARDEERLAYNYGLDD